MNAMLLEMNSKASSSKQTKHIKVKYFFVKDKNNHSKVIVEHCPTKQMWTNINTKPKQVWYSESSEDMLWASQQITKNQIILAMCQPPPPC